MMGNALRSLMARRSKLWIWAFAAASALPLAASAEPNVGAGAWWSPGSDESVLAVANYANASGAVGVLSANGPISTKGHPFFAPIGTNGRACVTCHQPSDGMSLSVTSARERWQSTGGKDPLFAAVDGSNCPSLPQGLESSHSLLLEKGLFRIALPWPPKDSAGRTVTPDFSIEVVSDPSTCNLDPKYGLKSASPQISVFRRPRMTANLRYVTTSFSLSGRFDGKIGMPLAVHPESGKRVGLPIMSDARHATLEAQAADATVKHLQMAKPASAAAIRGIVDFESQVYAAQATHPVAGSFDAPGTPPALGPQALAKGKAILAGFNYNSPVFFSFDDWKKPRAGDTSDQAEFRASVARGYDVFFLRPMWISDVAWFNSIGMGNPYKRTCAICHSVHLTGSDISPGVMDIGVNMPATSTVDRPDLPLFRIRCDKDAPGHPYLGRDFLTHDPGRALITGKCFDAGSLVMQQLRAMSARAPYFSNGSAKDIPAVVDFYDKRFNMKMTETEKRDLANFLSVL